MGLDIAAYQNARLLDDHVPHGWCDQRDEDARDWERHVQAFVYSGHETSAAGLELTGHEANGIHFGRCYDLTGGSYEFRAGSYSGYGMFRTGLCRAALGVDPEEVWANTDEYKERPFYELIHFADNEGWIGPVAAARLAEDFVTGHAIVQPQLEDWMAGRYIAWTTAFQLAANTGAVRFS